MEQIVRIYGKFLLNAMVVVLLIGMILTGFMDDAGNRGIFHMIGAYLAAAEIEEAIPEDFKVYQQEGLKEPPVIFLEKMGTLHTGVHVMSEYVKAVDYNQRELSIQLLGCYDSEERELEFCNMETSEVYFENSGIYTIEVGAADAENRRSICCIKLAVND